MMIVVPPTPQRVSRFPSIFRLAAVGLHLGGLCLTAGATGLMLSSAGLAALAGAALSVGERLHNRSMLLIERGAPIAAVAYRAREAFYARRRQGLAMD